MNRMTEWAEALPVFGNGRYTVETLGGRGSATLAGGRLTAKAPDSPGFVWVRAPTAP